MTDAAPLVTLAARPCTLYSLRIAPLWDGEDERIALDGSLEEIIATIDREQSIASLTGNNTRPMRFCILEQQDAIYLPGPQQTFYARERKPVWKVMVPASGIYRRETIMSCLDRSAGRNAEKYANVLYLYPQAGEFYTYANNEIRPVDGSIFVLRAQAR
jgi:hypothetical protein